MSSPLTIRLDSQATSQCPCAITAFDGDRCNLAPAKGGTPLRNLVAVCSAALALTALTVCTTGFAHTAPDSTCSNGVLNGRYVFTASGFTRAPASPPGSPWVPKAILEVLQFNGDGTLLTPALTAANPFGDLGTILQPPGSAPGEYTVNADCTGTVHFFDASNVTFTIYVESFGRKIRMIQTNPSNNVFEGTAKRSW